jgi:hypothetical protein
MAETSGANPADSDAKGASTDGAVRRAETAFRLADRAYKNALGSLVLLGLVNVGCLVTTVLDLTYLVSAGGTPSVERAQLMNERAGWLANLGWVAFIVGTVLLSRWVRATSQAVQAFGARVGASTRSIGQPFNGLRAVDEAMDDPVFSPPPQPATGAHAGGYRTPAVNELPKGQVGAAPLRAWGLLWLTCTGIVVFRWFATVSWMVAKELDTVWAVAEMAFTILGWVVVTRIGHRLRERAQRRLAASGQT